MKALDLPTAAGKTACTEIALYALAKQSRRTHTAWQPRLLLGALPPRGIDFADAMHLAASAACSEMLTFDDRGTPGSETLTHASGTIAEALRATSSCHLTPKPRPDRTRENRITYEIVVDAYNSDERALGWYYYLEEKLGFPFKARCIAPRAISPLNKGEEVEVIKMAPEDDCMQRMFVLVRFAGRKLGVPLEQLDPIDTDEATREAIED